MSEQSLPQSKRGRRGLSVVRKTTYTIDELHALVEKLRRQEPSSERIEKRRRLAEQADRWREEMPVIETPIEDWIRAERERRNQ